MPCLLPVIIIDVFLDEEASLTMGRKVFTPLSTPKRFVSRV
jgi:hypothetical protein